MIKHDIWIKYRPEPLFCWVKHCHLHHPPVITHFTCGMFTIPSHEWSMTLFYPHDRVYQWESMDWWSSLIIRQKNDKKKINVYHLWESMMINKILTSTFFFWLRHSPMFFDRRPLALCLLRLLQTMAAAAGPSGLTILHQGGHTVDGPAKSCSSWNWW